MNTISVVIPLYNRAELITETLASIEQQQRRPDEVIVVNDHSTDASVEMVHRFKKTSTLKIVLLENRRKKGVSGATNWGIKQAQGNWIALHDSDDLWMPCHLEQLENALMRFPESQLAFSAMDVFGSATDTDQKKWEFKTTTQKCLNYAFKRVDGSLWISNSNLLYALLTFGVPFRCQASLVRKEFLLDHKLSFDTDLAYTQDSHFITIASYFSPFVYLDTMGLKLRRHAGNDGDVSYGTLIQKSYEERIKKLKKFFAEHQLSPMEKKALEHRLDYLQTYISNEKASNQSFKVRTATALDLLRRRPGWTSTKNAVKLLIGQKIV